MRTTDQSSDYGDDSRSIGEGVPNSADSSPTDVDLVDYQDDELYEPSSPDGDDPYGPGNDTSHVDDALADLDDQEAEDLVLDVFEDVYGSEDMAEQAYDDIQQSTGLDAHDMLDVIFGSGDAGGDGYGDVDTGPYGDSGSSTVPGSEDDWYDDDPLGEDSGYDTDESVLPGDAADGSLGGVGDAAGDLFGDSGLTDDEGSSLPTVQSGDDLAGGDLEGADLDPGIL